MLQDVRKSIMGIDYIPITVVRENQNKVDFYDKTLRQITLGRGIDEIRIGWVPGIVLAVT